MHKEKIGVIWLRRDLRITDNKALRYLQETKLPILPIFCFTDSFQKQLGSSSQWWLGQALKDLQEQLQEIGTKLLISKSPLLKTFKELSEHCEIQLCSWNRLYSPREILEENELKQELIARKIEYFEGKDYLIHEPERLRSGSGNPYQKFTPFYKSCLKEYPSREKPKHTTSQYSIKTPLHKQAISIDHIIKKTENQKHLHRHWNPTQLGLNKRLQKILKLSTNYKFDRDFPAKDATSKLSAYLHWGQISPHAVLEHCKKLKTESAECLKSEIYWREFSYHILYNFPHTQNQALRKEFEYFPWESNESLFKRWKEGMTGYPFVDAGMRQLKESGWMHNRVRMVCASFLVKHLLQDWRLGKEYFEEMLTDADEACNSMNWQWAGGCGADAAPYFRIFNPILQSKKFDPENEYILQFIPELKSITPKYIHTPWEATKLRGNNYPEPIVDHPTARLKALDAYKKFVNLKSSNEY